MAIKRPFRTLGRSLSKWPQLREWVRLFVEIAAFVGLVFYVRATENQVAEIREANRLTRVAQRETEQNIADSDRPWVGVTRAHLTNFELGKAPTVEISYLNSGKTPALNVSGAITLHWFVAEQPVDEPSYHPPTISPPLRPGEVGSTTILFPNQTGALPVTASFLLDADRLRLIKTGRVWLIAVAWVSYEDKFKRSHRTQASMYYRPSDDSWYACADGNSAD